jgi:protein involved in polysaccharide export with SLBB domain
MLTVREGVVTVKDLISRLQIAVFMLCLFTGAFCTGCASSTGAVLRASDVTAINNQNDNETYVLGIGDIIATKFFYNEKLNEEVTVRPDGKISLQLIGDVTAAGVTPIQLATELRGAYSKVLRMDSPQVSVIVKNVKAPEMAVIVKDFTQQRVYVGGEVTRPGLIPLRGMLRMLDAVILTGGALNTANMTNVKLIRHKGSQKPDVYTFDLNSVIEGETPDIILKPYDIVYLPKTTISKVDLFMEQYLYKVFPFQTLFNLNYYINPAVNVP